MINRTISTLLAVILLLPGCAKHQETDTRVIRPPEWNFILIFLVDPSRRFAEKKFDAAAHRFLVGTAENYFRGRSEPDDRVLLASLTDEGGSPLLWQGTPRDLRRQFDTPEALRDFVTQHSRPTKHVYASLAKTLDYVSDLPPVHDGKAKAVVVVLSDMLDDSKTREQDLVKAAAALKRFTALRSEIGHWWVDWDAVPDFKKWYRKADLPEPHFIQQEPNPKPLTFE